MPKVLVVDDSLTTRRVVEWALETRGIQVVSAATGSEAIERLEREAPDLVICDVIMPDTDGYQICEYIKKHPKLGTIPVLLISGMVGGAVLERAATVGSDGLIRKPFGIEELVRKVESFLPVTPPPVPFAAQPASPPRVAIRGQKPGPDARGGPPAPDLKASLAQVARASGVLRVALVDREGFLVESAGESEADADVAWALTSAVVEASEAIGRELGQGVLHAMILEYESGIVLLHTLAPAAMLAVVVKDPTRLGKIRENVKRALPDLLRAV